MTAAADSPEVTAPSLYLDGIPHDRFAAMRTAPGLTWHRYEEGGFWAVSRHGDVRAVSRNPEVFSSGIGHTNLWDLEADALAARRSLIDTDPPDHTRLRRIVSRHFTPRNVARLTAATRAIAAELLEDFVASGGGDWVKSVAAPLPIRVIMLMLGVPEADANYLIELSDYLVEGTGDRSTLPPDAFGNTTPLRLLPFGSPASHALFVYGEELGERRRAEPAEDLVTELVLAADGGLSPAEYRNFFQLLVFAGNETTRTAIVHGALAFAEQPDELRRLTGTVNSPAAPSKKCSAGRRRCCTCGAPPAATPLWQHGRRRRRQGRDVVRLGQPGSGHLRRPVPLRRVTLAQ